MSALKNIRVKKMIAQGGCCYYCGLSMWDEAAAAGQRDHLRTKPLKNLRCTAEHLQSRCEGGGDTADNIVAACYFCNIHRHRRKRPLSPEAYRHHVQRRMAAGRWLWRDLHHGLDGHSFAVVR